MGPCKITCESWNGLSLIVEEAINAGPAIKNELATHQ